MKQIAVVLGAINLDSQKKILAGMSDAAKEKDCNLYVFTNYVGTRETEESVVASNRVLKLLDYTKFDGVILAVNTVHHPVAVKRLIEDTQKSQIPAVSIDREFEGMSCVSVDTYAAQYEVVEHFICEHGCKDIFYVSGALEVSMEAQKRYKAYQDAMAKHNLYASDDTMFNGGFTFESGVWAGEEILKRDKLPEAIVCGSDDMAFGVMKVLGDAGYSVLKDYKISGLDNVELSRINTPTLTTVDKNQYGVGYKSVCEVLDLINGKQNENHILPCKPDYRESCGCISHEGGYDEAYIQTLLSAKEKYVSQQHETMRMSDVVRGMTTDFGKARSTYDVFEILKNYIQMVGVKTFYLCMCEMEKVFVLPERNYGQNIDILKVVDDYTPLIEIPVAYENGEFTTYQRFEKGYVLPEECRNKVSGKTYVINQIFYENCCYGYAVCEQLETVVTSGLYYSLLMEIGVGLEDTRKWMLLKDAVEHLNGMWCYDNMTQLYNRSGFYNEAESLLERYKEEDMAVFILFMDADGLKPINDNIGHDAGDALIKAVADIIRKNINKDMLAMRYGGDEFVVFGGFGKDERKIVEDFAAAINRDIDEINESGKYPFHLSVSMGGSGWLARDIEDLSGLIKQADEKMYIHKREKKKKAAESSKK